MPPQPERVTVSGITPHQVTLAWTVPTLADLGQTPVINRYYVEVARGSAADEPSIVDVSVGFQIGQPFALNYTELSPATNYSIRLAAANTEGQVSAWHF